MRTLTDPTNTARQRAFRQRQKETRANAIALGAPTGPATPTMPGTARWKAMQEQATRALETIIQEMEAYQADRSEEWQESDKGEEFQDKLTEIQCAFDALDAISP